LPAVQHFCSRWRLGKNNPGIRNTKQQSETKAEGIEKPIAASQAVDIDGSVPSRVSRAFSSEVDTGSREETRQNKNLEPRSDSIGTGKALDDASHRRENHAQRKKQPKLRTRSASSAAVA
jgi:hypothetical protein